MNVNTIASRISKGTTTANNMQGAAFDLCIQKVRNNIKTLADEPKSAPWAADGNYFAFKEGFYEIGNWTSSFFTGMALIAWRDTEDEFFLNQVLRLAPFYREKVFTHHLDTHHDLGFLYTLYSVALYKLTENKEDRDVALRAADLLIQRFNTKGNFIRAWGRMDTDEHANMAIIDCLMNLPLLYWATEETGDQKYRRIAIKHADMCLKCFIRPDNSVLNVFKFDLKTGEPLEPEEQVRNGYWARGAAWAIYGFALSYGYTRDPRYLDASARLARKFVSELDAEVVPLNDFRLPEFSGIRDASAGAVVVCGFQELEKHQAADPLIVQTKRTLLEKLCTRKYLDFDPDCCGVQTHGQGGKNGYTSWGDYYLMEALAKENKQFGGWW